MPSHPDRVRRNYCEHPYSNEGKCTRCGKQLTNLQMVKALMNKAADDMHETLAKEYYSA